MAFTESEYVYFAFVTVINLIPSSFTTYAFSGIRTLVINDKPLYHKWLSCMAVGIISISGGVTFIFRIANVLDDCSSRGVTLFYYGAYSLLARAQVIYFCHHQKNPDQAKIDYTRKVMIGSIVCKLNMLISYRFHKFDYELIVCILHRFIIYQLLDYILGFQPQMLLDVMKMII